MLISLKKFGTTLTSRQLGKEAFAAFKPSLEDVGDGEKIEVDFDGVITFSPSWGAEFLAPLLEKYGKNVVLLNTSNSSVKATLKLLEDFEGMKFVVQS